MAKRRTFTVILEPEADGGYSAHCPALPGCHSQGESRAEALDNIKEAIELVLEVLRSEAAAPVGASGRARRWASRGPEETADAVAEEIRHILRARHEDGLPLTIETAQVEVAPKVPA